VTAGLGQQVGRSDPLGRREVEERQGAHAGASGDAAGVGRRRVAGPVQELGPRVESAGLVDQQVGAPGGLDQRVTRPRVTAVDDAGAVALDDAPGRVTRRRQVVDRDQRERDVGERLGDARSVSPT
jgi:hypothetical protein